jgi:protein-disulfide isomerase
VPAALRAAVLALVCNLNAALPAFADDDLVRRIKDEVLRELRDDKWLAEQIDLGIQRYIEKMNAAQAAEAAERARQADAKAAAVRRPAAARDHIRGPLDAEISLIEYSDFECPYCKSFHQSAAELLAQYPGRVNWVYRHFPLAFHNPGAQTQAEAAECARHVGGAPAFWRYADALFARTTSGGKGFPVEKLAPLAQELGLERGAFEDCVASGRYGARVKADVDEGQKIGITGTPSTVILNNRTGEARLVVGALPVSELKARIGQLAQWK